MVRSCSAYFCTNRFKKGSGLSFHRFPSNPERFDAWVRAINRLNIETGELWIPTEYDSVCGAHFQTGKPSTDPQHPDYIPNINLAPSCNQLTKRAIADDYEARKKRCLYKSGKQDQEVSQASSPNIKVYNHSLRTYNRCCELPNFTLILEADSLP